MASTTKRTLNDHVMDSLVTLLWRQLDDQGRARDEQHREMLATWIETAHERLRTELSIKAPSGRADTRSLRAVVWIELLDGNRVELFNGLARHLCDENGDPVPAQATARELLAAYVDDEQEGTR